MIEIEGPDGVVYEFPAGTPDATIKSAMARQYPTPAPAASPQPVPPVGPTGDEAAAVGQGIVSGVPVAGPYLLGGLNRVAAGVRSLQSGRPFADELAEVQRFSEGTAKANPRSAMAGEMAGAVLGTLPMAAAAPGAFGIGAGSLVARSAASAGTGAAIGAADAGVRSEGNPDAIKQGGLYGLIGGGLAPGVASALGGAARAAISPFQTQASRAPLIQTLEREGVTLTAGQRTGSKPLQYMESMTSELPLAGGGARRIMEDQSRQFTAAAARRMGEAADNLGPETMERAASRIGNEFETISARNALMADARLGEDIVDAYRGFIQSSPAPGQLQRLSSQVQRIQGSIDDQTHTIPGRTYQSLRSSLRRLAKSADASDPDYASALRGLRRALDASMARSVSPADAAAWHNANRQYAAMKTLERAMGGAGANTAEGALSPLQLRTAVAAENRPAYVRGRGDLAELARAGVGLLSPLPNSGTAQRTLAAGLLGAAGGYGFSQNGLEGGALGLLGPALAGRVLMSGPGQRLLANRVGETLGPALGRGAGLLTFALPPAQQRQRLGSR